jgi:hypothetical protein
MFILPNCLQNFHKKIWDKAVVSTKSIITHVRLVNMLFDPEKTYFRKHFYALLCAKSQERSNPQVQHVLYTYYVTMQEPLYRFPSHIKVVLAQRRREEYS